MFSDDMQGLICAFKKKQKTNSILTLQGFFSQRWKNLTEVKGIWIMLSQIFLKMWKLMYF